MSRENWHMNPFARLYPRKFRSSNMHRIKFVGNGKFVMEWGFEKEDTPFVYSSHHQAVGKLGKGIRIIATSLWMARWSKPSSTRFIPMFWGSSSTPNPATYGILTENPA
jgi:hypothetical protein